MTPDYSSEYLGIDKEVNRLQPVMSVRLITYNHAPYIARAIESVLAQRTSFPIEIIVGEDESSDGTREICMKYARENQDRIRLFLRSEENRIYIDDKKTGRFNWITSMQSCRGKYIALLDGDDAWTDPEKLEKQYACLEAHPETVICGHNFKQVLEKGQSLGVIRRPARAGVVVSKEEMLADTPFHTSTMCFRNLIPEWPEEMRHVLSGDTFLCSLLSAFGNGRFIPEISPGIYTIHRGGVWSRIDVRQKFRITLNTHRYLLAYYRRTGHEAHVKTFETLIEAEEKALAKKISSMAIIRERLILFQLLYLGNSFMQVKQFVRDRLIHRRHQDFD